MNPIGRNLRLKGTTLKSLFRVYTILSCSVLCTDAEADLGLLAGGGSQSVVVMWFYLRTGEHTCVVLLTNGGGEGTHLCRSTYERGRGGTTPVSFYLRTGEGRAGGGREGRAAGGAGRQAVCVNNKTAFISHISQNISSHGVSFMFCCTSPCRRRCGRAAFPSLTSRGTTAALTPTSQTARCRLCSPTTRSVTTRHSSPY